jgi:hypothetical protein
MNRRCAKAGWKRVWLCTLSPVVILRASANAATDSTPIPEYYGLYAVAGGKLLGIDVPQSTMTPKHASVRLGKRAAVGAILDGAAPGSSGSVEVPELPATVQFIVFVQSGGAVTPMMIGQSMYLRGLVFVQTLSVDTGWPNNVRRRGELRAWDTGDPSELGGLAQSDITQRTVLLAKPVPGHNDMVILVPANPLTPGVYAFGQGETEAPFAQRPFMFAVPPAADGEARKCVDESCTYAMMASKCEASPCAGNRASPGAPPPPSSAPSTQNPAIAAGSVGTFRGTVTASGRSTNVEAVCNGEAGRIVVTGGRGCEGVLWSPGGKAWIYMPSEHRVRHLDADGWMQTDVAGTGLSPAQMASVVCKVGGTKSDGITFVPSSSSASVAAGDLTVEALVNTCN